LIEEAAALFESLSQNHPFLDGNKRAAITCTAVFLRINGYLLSIDDSEAHEWMLRRYEDGTMNKAGIEEWLRQRVSGS